MRKPSVVLILAALTLLASRCLDDSTVEIEEDTEPLYFETVTQGIDAGVADTVEAVIRGQDSWVAALDTFDLRREPPEVDFDQVIVLLAAIPTPGSGYTVEFRSVELGADSVIAHYAVGVPAEDCITAMGETVPFQAVTVRRVDVPVAFERSREEIRCTFR